MMQANMNSPVIRAMHAHDLNQVMAVQVTCYHPAYHEPLSVLQQRLHASPQTAWVAVDAQGVAGYLVSYLSCWGKITPLHHNFERAGQPDLLYIHDLAIDPRLSGQGLAARLIQIAVEAAQRQHLRGLGLVAVQDALGFWQRYGFETVTRLPPQQQAHLASYGAEAVYLYADLARLAHVLG